MSFFLFSFIFGRKKPNQKQKLKPHNPVPKKKAVSVEGIKQKLVKANDSKCILINMEMNNGFFRTFLINEKEGSFEINKRTYIIDLNLKYYNLDAKYWCLDYHEALSIPIRRKINVQGIKEAVETADAYDSETATNPSLISTFMRSNIIEQVVKGAELSKWLQAMRLMILVILIAVIIHLILFMFKSGMFSEAVGMFQPK
jgi:hypothetical protein